LPTPAQDPIHGTVRPPGWPRALTLTVVQCTATVVLLLTAYGLLPDASADSWELALRLSAAVVLTLAVLGFQLRAVNKANYPVLRAVRALVTTAAVFILTFAALYLSLDHGDAASFNAPLTRVDAVYFTVTVLATVGFGDISAVSQAARILVTVQMLLNLALLGASLRLLLGRARSRAAAARRG
jgi:hypothetical protein